MLCSFQYDGAGFCLLLVWVFFHSRGVNPFLYYTEHGKPSKTESHDPKCQGEEDGYMTHVIPFLLPEESKLLSIDPGM